MLDRETPIVQIKLDVLDRLLPAESAVVFGDIYGIDGGYSVEIFDRGTPRVVLIDTLETAAWQRERIDRPALDFRKGDFSDSLFMLSIREQFEVSVAFDILLHQAPLVHTLNLMLRLTADRIAIVQPMLRELEFPNALVYLPGNTATDLYPEPNPKSDIKVFDVEQVNHAYWQWGMTATFLESVLAGEGFELLEATDICPLPNPRWYWYSAIAKRVRKAESHWTEVRPTPGLFPGPWDRAG